MKGLLKGKGLFTIMNCGFLGGAEEDSLEMVLEYLMKNGIHIWKLTSFWWWSWWDWWEWIIMEDLWMTYPKNLSANYSKEIEKLRKDLTSSLQKTFVDKKIINIIKEGILLPSLNFYQVLLNYYLNKIIK